MESRLFTVLPIHFVARSYGNLLLSVILCDALQLERYQIFYPSASYQFPHIAV
jgi:hypothetical protein